MKERYKKTELGFVPKEWNLKRLEECTIKITDGSHSSPIPVNDSKYRICTVANMNRSKLDVNDAALITKEDYERLIKNGCKPEVGDILLSKDGTIGKTLVFDQSEEDIVLLSSIAIIRPNKKEIISEYLNQYLKDESTLNRLINSKTGSAIKRIVLRDIKTIKLLVPPLKEQEKIVDILSTIDFQIDDTDKIIEKTKELKKGLMQRLLTKGIGHKEFKKTEVGEIPVEWEVKKLSEVTEIVSGGTPKTNVTEYWDNPTIHWATPTDITKNEKYICETEKKISEIGLNNSSANLLPIGTVLMTSRATVGERCINTTPMATNQGFKSFICSEFLNNEFLYYYIDILKEIMISLSAGSTFIEISKLTVCNLKIAVPSIGEQEKIAKILSSVDCQIEEYENKKIKLEELKKGLMQQLLTGKIRINNI